MSDTLSRIPVEKRRQLAATLGLFAVLFVAMGLVATTGREPTVVRVFSAVALVVSVLLGLMAWGVTRSVHLDMNEQRLDRAIENAVAARHGKHAVCNCPVPHDMDELTVDRAAGTASGSAGGCAHDGRGSDCTHDCQTCVLAAMRPSPDASRSERLA